MADISVEKNTSDKIYDRLRRLEGQLRGITSMLENGRSCEEVITQLSAISSGITAVAREVLYGHLEHHVAEGIRSGNERETIEGLKSAVESFSKLK